MTRKKPKEEDITFDPGLEDELPTPTSQIEILRIDVLLSLEYDVLICALPQR